MLDDDTLVSAPDLSFAFSVWKVVGSTKIQMRVVTLTLNCNIHSDADQSRSMFGSTAISRPDCWVCPAETCLNARRSVQLWQLWTAGPRNIWRGQVSCASLLKLHICCIFLATCLIMYTYILVRLMQILDGVNWCCLLPPPLPAALPGPTSRGARAGGRDAELWRHCHKLCRRPVFEETLHKQH